MLIVHSIWQSDLLESLFCLLLGLSSSESTDLLLRFASFSSFSSLFDFPLASKLLLLERSRESSLLNEKKRKISAQNNSFISVLLQFNFIIDSNLFSFISTSMSRIYNKGRIIKHNSTKIEMKSRKIRSRRFDVSNILSRMKNVKCKYSCPKTLSLNFFLSDALTSNWPFNLLMILLAILSYKWSRNQ